MARTQPAPAVAGRCWRAASGPWPAPVRRLGQPALCLACGPACPAAAWRLCAAWPMAAAQPASSWPGPRVVHRLAADRRRATAGCAGRAQRKGRRGRRRSLIAAGGCTAPLAAGDAARNPALPALEPAGAGAPCRKPRASSRCRRAAARTRQASLAADQSGLVAGAVGCGFRCRQAKLELKETLNKASAPRRRLRSRPARRASQGVVVPRPRRPTQLGGCTIPARRVATVSVRTRVGPLGRGTTTSRGVRLGANAHRNNAGHWPCSEAP